MDRVKRLAPLATLCVLAAATPPAGAHTTGKLTRQQASHAIHTEYAYQRADTHGPLRIDQCRRLDRTTIDCRVVDQIRRGCYSSQHWIAYTTTQNGVAALEAGHMRVASWGTCPNGTVTVTPIDGQPTINTPN